MTLSPTPSSILSRTHFICRLGALCLCMVVSLHGATRVEYSAPTGLPFFADSQGAGLPLGNAVRIGFFAGGVDPSDPNLSLADLQAAWRQYGATTIGTNNANPGRFDVFSEQNDAQFSDQKAYLWVFKTSDNAIPTGDFGNVTEYGFFSGSAWRFPVLGSLPTSSTLTVNTGTTTRGVTETIHGLIEADRLRIQPVAPAGLTYDQWAMDPAVFEAATPAEQRTKAANPEHDELTNLEEFFHRLLPLQVEVHPMTVSLVESGGQSFFEVSFPRRRNLSGVNHRFETASTLPNWQTVSPDSETVQEVDANIETVTARILITNPGRQFVRLAVESP